MQFKKIWSLEMGFIYLCLRLKEEIFFINFFNGLLKKYMPRLWPHFFVPRGIFASSQCKRALGIQKTMPESQFPGEV
jgi:hypothetical protein